MDICCGFRRHGKLLEEGASGFLQKKLANDCSKESGIENSDINWNSVNKIFSGDSSEECASFGSKHWASVYLASTPQQAAAMGLKFPGVDEVIDLVLIDFLPYDIIASGSVLVLNNVTK